MSTQTQQASHIAYPPDEIINLSGRTTRVFLNIRSEHWPQSIVNSFHSNYPQRNRKHSLFPLFAQFLSQLNTGTKVVICCQDAKGGIITIVDTIKEVAWTGEGDDKSIHASVWLENKHRFGAPAGSIWGNFVLAIAKVYPTADTESRRDPNGFHFVKMFEHYGAI